MNKRRILITSAVLLLSAFCILPSAFAQGGVKGKLRNTKGGAIAGATVTARLDGKDVKTVTTDSKGGFLMEGLNSGTYNFAFDADGYSSGVKAGVPITNGSVRDLGDRLVLAVDRGTLIIIKGSVFTKEGTSVRAAKVEIARVNDDGSVKTLGTVYTNISGEFTYTLPLGAEKVKVTAKYKGASNSKEISEMVNSGIYRTAITLDISGSEK